MNDDLELERYELFEGPTYNVGFDRRQFLKAFGGGIALIVPMSRIESAPRSMRRLLYGGNSLSCAFGLAPAASRMSIISRFVVSSSDKRSGRPPCGSVLKSTAR